MTLPTRIYAELLTKGETSSGVWSEKRLTSNARAYVPEDDAQKAMLEQMREALEEMTTLARALTSKHVRVNGQYIEVREAIGRARAVIEVLEATR